MNKYSILLECQQVRWFWCIISRDDDAREECQLAFGTSPDYRQACEQARIALEQHSKGDA